MDTAMHFVGNILSTRTGNGKHASLWNAVKGLRSHADAMSGQKSFSEEQEQRLDFAGISEWQMLESEMAELSSSEPWGSL